MPFPQLNFKYMGKITEAFQLHRTSGRVRGVVGHGEATIYFIVNFKLNK